MTTRLKDNFKPDEPLAAIEADWLNTVARWLNTINVNGGPRFATPFQLDLWLASGVAGGTTVGASAWYSTYSGMNITIKPGDIELGPDTVIEWGDITNASETVTAADESPTWFVWVNVDISTDPPTAEMYDGETVTALSDEQKLTTYQKRICKVTITNDEEDPTNDVINGIAVYQCGNITIPRAAG